MLCGAHRQVALEDLALRHQLAVYKKMVNRPKVRGRDRLFWVALSRVWPGWRQALVIVSPDTVLRWQRRRFRNYWAKLSGRPTGGRPQVDSEIAALVRRMAAANPLWGAPRIHGELIKLGLDVSERTVSRLIPNWRPQPSQTWRTFLANHVRSPMGTPNFLLGRLVATPGAIGALARTGEHPLHFIVRHMNLDPGVLGADDQPQNLRAVREGRHVFSAYELRDGTRIWIITEADRSVTTILLPEEY
jgi:hypothetical protein